MDIKNLHIDELVEYLRNFGDVILLESQKEDHPSSEHTFVAGMPKESIFGFPDHNYHVRGNLINQLEEPDPWNVIDAFKTETNDWLFGYFGYDLKNSIEQLESTNENLDGLPLFYFMRPGVLVQFDKDGAFNILKGRKKIRNVIPDSIGKNDHFSIGSEESITEGEYVGKVLEAKRLIHEGEVYELNYSYAKKYTFEGEGWSLYKKMRNVGPVPFASYLQLNDIEVSCASPERFLSRKGNTVFSQPIKGTVSNVGSKDISRLKSEKNLAENLMIVDLVRNDLNRVAIPGSVEVEKLFEVQSFETVHQLVSTVKCEVSPETSSVHIIKACFPMGSMTGAPKIAAMKVIEELENYSRNLYSGAIGYFKPNGDFDFNVVIRTAIMQENTLIYPVGGAITSDSDPEDEWDETQVKTEALKKALIT